MQDKKAMRLQGVVEQLPISVEKRPWIRQWRITVVNNVFIGVQSFLLPGAFSLFSISNLISEAERAVTDQIQPFPMANPLILIVDRGEIVADSIPPLGERVLSLKYGLPLLRPRPVAAKVLVGLARRLQELLGIVSSYQLTQAIGVRPA